jgi:hypothetical protein
MPPIRAAFLVAGSASLDLTFGCSRASARRPAEMSGWLYANHPSKPPLACATAAPFAVIDPDRLHQREEFEPPSRRFFAFWAS